ncbi:MAG TPA: aldehyde dehydrogenase family protein, partial [Microvirga sp.]|nr:aldehyde dehydrogenase family protein [Microvirga sp.]
MYLISPVPKASEWHALRTGLRFETRLFIGGEFVAARGGGVLESVNPFTGEVTAEVSRGDAEDVDRAVAAARKSFRNGVWRRMRPRERKEIL